MRGIDSIACVAPSRPISATTSSRSATCPRSWRCTASQLFKRLRRLTGRSPSEVIAGCRLQRAASLLRAGAGSVSEVAYAAGFHSVAHFSRVFHERFGQAPSAWRRLRN